MNGSSTPVILTAPSVEQDTRTVTRDDDGRGFDESWFCVQTDPFPCPGEGCDFVATFMTASHLIIVWPRGDDPALLGAAANAREVGRNPRIVNYREEFGKALAWDAWCQMGQHVHGTRDRPDGWEKRPWKI
jgi:hypothetical protein